MSPSLPRPSTEVHRYRGTVSWSGRTGVGYDHYDRTHRATTVPPTTDLQLSADPAFHGDPDRPDPEQLVVLAAASCQLLSFLAVAARSRLDVIDYRDEPEGTMPADDLPVRLTRIDLRPRITVVDPAAGVDDDALRGRVRHLCEVAHRECYIANSLRTEIVVEPTVIVATEPNVFSDTPADPASGVSGL